MAYNYYQPYNSYYQQMPYNATVTASQPQQTSTDDRIWVASQNGAEAYPMGVNDHKILWDGSKPVFYEKRTDASGRPFPMVTYEYKVKTEAEPVRTASADYEERISKLEEKIAKLEEAKKPVKTKKEETNE